MTKNYLQCQKWKQKSPARAQTLPRSYLAQHISGGTSNSIILRQIKHKSHHTFSGSQNKDVNGYELLRLRPSPAPHLD